MPAPEWAKPIPKWAKPVNGTTEPAEKGFAQRVDEAWTKREQNVDAMVTRNTQGNLASDIMNVPAMGVLAAGQVAGGVVDVATEALGSAYKTVVPDWAQNKISGGLKDLANTDIGQKGIKALQKGGEYYGKFKEIYPDAAMALEGAGNMFMVRPTAKIQPTVMPKVVEGIKKATPKAIKEVPERLYQSAAKFSTVIPAKKRQAMARLALDEGISPTIKGWEKIQNKITSLNDEITVLIDKSTATGRKIKQGNLLKYFDDLRTEAQLTGSPKSSISAINNIEKQMIEAGKQFYTPKEAQQFKQAIYRDLETAYGKLSAPYKTKAQQAMARAAKEELEAIYPQLATLNAKEGALMNLRESIEQASNRIMNRDILGIGIPIKGTMGATAAGPMGAAMGLAQGILDAPRVKAALASALNKIGKIEGNIPLPGQRTAIMAGKEIAVEDPLGIREKGRYKKKDK